MTDRELLELAAKAVGNVLGGDVGEYLFAHHNDDNWGLYLRLANGLERGWNPLTDDGDALRLAVKLRLHIGLENEVVSAWAKDDFGNFQTERFYDHGDNAATRRAIVRAAAECCRAFNQLKGQQ